MFGCRYTDILSRDLFAGTPLLWMFPVWTDSLLKTALSLKIVVCLSFGISDRGALALGFSGAKSEGSEVTTMRF
jgi:hypothetical protein